MKHIVLALVLVLLGVFKEVNAWGPVSHLFFASQALPEFDLDSVKQGCDMPDSFYFSNFAQYPNCSIDISFMHNPTTAGYFVKFALNTSNTYSSYSSSSDSLLDPLSLALGFGSHMISDYVGFHSSASYLGIPVTSYLLTFPFMSAIDALAITLSETPLITPSPWESLQAAQFISDASAYYHGISSSFPAFTVQQVYSCIGPWNATATSLAALAELQIKPSQYYQSAVVHFDQFGATSFSEAQKHFLLSNDCAVKAVKYWANLIIQTSVSPQSAVTSTFSYVDSLFAAGSCSPN